MRLIIVLLMIHFSVMAQPSKIVTCIGDSNTQRGYPKILQKKLGNHWAAINCGIGAATVVDGTMRPFHKMKQYNQALNSKADIVVIMLGTNDANPKWWDTKRKTDFKGTSADEFKYRYLDLIQRLKAMSSRPQLILCLPLPVFPEKAKPTHRENAAGRKANLVNKVIPLLKEIAKEQNLPLVDIHSHMATSQELSTDGVHFNKLGYDRMSELIAKAIKGLKK